ncbi:MAG: hypothetical protein ABJN36_09435 [Cyclobacteriaceae bacterium]
MRFFKRFKRKCPDGTIHWIYRSIDDAFPLIVADKENSLNSKVNVDSIAAAEIGSKHISKIKGLLFGLDSANQNIMIEFRAVYSVYQAEPCGNAKFFSDKISEIIDDHKLLRQLKTKIEGLVNILNTNNISEEGFLAAYVNIINDYGKYLPQEAAKVQIELMARESKKWQNKKEGGTDEDG